VANLPITHLISMLATWIQAPSGPYGYRNLLSFAPASAPLVPSGLSTLALEPFAGAFFRLPVDQVGYPGTQGPDVLYVGLNGQGQVDQDDPFDVSDGVLLVYNRDFEWSSWATQWSGPDIAAIGPAWAPLPARDQPPAARARFARWRNPPPRLPDDPAWEPWRAARSLERP